MSGQNRRPSATYKEMVLERELRAAVDSLPWPADGPPQLVSALLHIKERLFDPDLTVADLRRQCGLHNHNITTRFRSRFGLGLRAFIERRRILAAQRVLRYEDLEIWRISDALGFASQETFARAFKRQTGTTATNFRRFLLSDDRGSRPATRIEDRVH